MDKESQYLLHLLGACLRGEAPREPGEVDWERLVQLAQIHSVPGILGYMAMKYPICPDAQRQRELRELCLKTLSVFTRRYALAEELSAELETAGIDHILMKGYVLRDAYPVPELRTFNDVDLVIRPENRQRSHELMLALGFRVHTDWEPVYSYVRGQEYYEIHTDIMEIDVSDKADYRGYFARMWQYARPVSQHSCRFTPEFHFLYLLTHIAKHVHGAGAGARMYLDAAAVIRRDGAAMDWDWIAGELEKLKLTEFAAVVLTAAESWFGVACPMAYKRVPDSVMAEFEAFTMEAGVFGHHNREGALAGLKHTDQAQGAARLRQLARRTFPSAKTIQSRYTYLQDKPWLLPAAWVHRLVKTRGSLGKHAQEAQKILHADTAQIRRLQDLMRDIGL